MNKETFTVATDYNMDLTAIELPEEMVDLTEAYSTIIPPIGKARVFYDEDTNTLKCEADIFDLLPGQYYLMTPGIWLAETETRSPLPPFPQYITKGKCVGISLFMGPNQDPAVAPIGWQLGKTGQLPQLPCLDDIHLPIIHPGHE